MYRLAASTRSLGCRCQSRNSWLQGMLHFAQETGDVDAAGIVDALTRMLECADLEHGIRTGGRGNKIMNLEVLVVGFSFFQMISGCNLKHCCTCSS